MGVIRYEGLGGDKVLGGDQLRRLLERAKEKRYYEVPLPVAEYDSAPTGLELVSRGNGAPR